MKMENPLEMLIALTECVGRVGSGASQNGSIIRAKICLTHPNPTFQSSLHITQPNTEYGMMMMIHGEMSELGDVRLYLFVNKCWAGKSSSVLASFEIITRWSLFYWIQYGNFRVHQNSSYHDLNSMKKLIGILPKRSERSSDLGTCYIIMIGKFFSSCHTSNPKIRKKLVAIKMMLLAMKKFILHATTFSNQKMRGIFLCLQL